MLGMLCTALGIAFDEAMLSWSAGRRESDGVWAPAWYQAVERSTGFAPYMPEKRITLPEELQRIADAAAAAAAVWSRPGARPWAGTESTTTVTTAEATHLAGTSREGQHDEQRHTERSCGQSSPESAVN